jgi:hypothetical protein
MVRACVVFALVVGEVLLAGVPTKFVHTLGNFVTNPKKSHIHGS